MIIQTMSIVVPTKNRCVNDCKFCVSKTHTNDYEDRFKDKESAEYLLYKSDIRRRFDYAKLHKVDTINLTGTVEALQNVPFLLMMDMILKEMDNPFPRIELQTSGVMLTDTNLHILRQIGVSTISLSISDVFNDESNLDIIGVHLKLQFKLEVAYKNFFKLHKGFPKFKSKHDEQKVRFPQEAVASKTFDEETSRLNLTKTIKGLKFECSCRDKQYLYKNKQGIKSVTITKNKSGKYFATILIDGDLLKTVNKSNKSVGIDLGIKTLLTFSDGKTIDNPRWIKTNEKKLKKVQKQLSKKIKGSKNRNKVRLKLAKLHESIKNQKQDFLHNITTKIINENQVIVLEDLNVSGMMKNHKLAKSIQELGLYEMRRQLEYKSKWYGRELIFVSRWFPSSKTCCECGWKNNNLTLKDREFVCEECGNVIDRDMNAAINIEREGIRIYNEQIGTRYPEFTLVDNPTMDDKDESPLKSSGWMKQEEKTKIHNFS
jgi:putative transposase